MSNAAVIKLQKKQIGAHHVWLDDNFGEAIHVHIDDFRADLSNREFAQMYSDLCDAINELIQVDGFDCHKISPVYLEVMLWKDLCRLEKVKMDEIPLSQLRVAGQGKYGGEQYDFLPDSWCVKELDGIGADAGKAKDSNYSGQSNQERWDSVYEFVKEHGYPCDGEYIILYGDSDVIKDGQHRAACLWKLNGGGKVPVMRLYFRDYKEPELEIPAWKNTYIYQLLRRAGWQVKNAKDLLIHPRKAYRQLKLYRRRKAADQKLRQQMSYLNSHREKMDDILSVFEGRGE